VIHSCAKCTKLHEGGSDDYRSLCLSCWRAGWRLDSLYNLVPPNPKATNGNQ
jgi:hypothetical protein